MKSVRPVSLAAVLAAGLVAGLPTAAWSAPAAKVPTCQGKKATIVVTGSHASVTGTNKADVIVALGDGDVIKGLGGNDRICAGNAKSIDGGDGNDSITFWGGGTVHGGKGNDTIRQLAAPSKKSFSPKIYGDAGNDTITLGSGSGKAYGGDGNDTLYGGTGGTQTLDGGNGNDRLKGGKSGTFHLFGGNGNDVLMVVGGSGTIDGQGGSNAVSVPGVLLKKYHLTLHAGDTLNGQKQGTGPTPPPVVTPPVVPPVATGPAAMLTGDGQVGSDAVSLESYNNSGFAEVGFGAAATETTPGAAITHWSLDFGDGAPAHSGSGLPQSYVNHNYVTAGSYRASLTVTDSAGATAVSAVAVSVALRPTLTLGAAVVSGRTVTIPSTATHGAGAAITSYEVSWGDGSVDTGMTAPPATLTHTYTADGSFGAYVQLQDDHGGYAAQEAPVAMDASGQPVAHIDGETAGLQQFSAVEGTTQRVVSTDRYGQESQFYEFDTSICPHSGVATFATNVDGKGFGGRSNYDGFSQSWATGTHTLGLELFCNGTLATQTSVTVDAERAAIIDGVAPGVSSVAVGQAVSLKDSFFAPAPVVLTGYTVSWGDTPDPVAVAASSVPSTLTHTYAAPGSYPVSLSLTDSYGGYDNFQVQVEVTGAAPSFVLAGGGENYYEVTGWLGTTASTQLDETVGRYEESDTYLSADSIVPSTGRTLASYDLNFGDATPDYSGVFTDDQRTVGSVGREHAYVADGDHIATLTIRQDDGSTFTRRLTVNVAEVPTVTFTLSNPAPKVGDTETLTPAVTTGGGIADSWYAYAYDSNGALVPSPAGFGNGTPPVLTFTVTHAGTAHVTLGFSTDHGSAQYDTSVTVSA